MTEESGLVTGPMTGEERAAADEWLASGGAAPAPFLTPAPPGPNPGQPGHFAHHNWLEASVLALALPLPAFITSNPATQTFVTTSWVFWASMTVPMTNPSTTKTLRCFVTWQYQTTVTQTICCAVQTTGATVLDEGLRSEESREGTSTSTVTGTGSRVVDINPGTTNFRLGGKLIAAGSQPMSYGKLVVIPEGFI